MPRKTAILLTFPAFVNYSSSSSSGKRLFQTAAAMSSSSHSFRGSVDILEELQLIAAQNLEKLDMDKYYEVLCELGKGTYGKVDLVVHKIRGEPQLAAPSVLRPSIALPPDCVLCAGKRAGRHTGPSP